jgi:type IV pilus assembly protein PilC
MAGTERAGRLDRELLRAPSRPWSKPHLHDAPPAPASFSRGPRRRARRRVGDADVAMLTYDLSNLLGAGLPLAQALDVLAEQATEQRLREVLLELSREIEEGRKFSEALARFPDLFPPLYRGIVTNGEASGRLDYALERLAAFLERDLEFRKKVRDVLIYPALVMIMAGAVLSIFLVFIIPAFERVYARSHATLPLLTLLLLGLSRAVRMGLPFMVLAAMLLFVPRVRGWVWRAVIVPLQRAVLTLPRVGTLAQTALLSRFAHSMAMMLQSGVPLLAALDVAGAVGGPLQFDVMVGSLKHSVVQGRRLSEAMRASGWFTPVFVRMVSVGEETGRLDVMLARVAGILDRDFDTRIRRVLTLLEPLLILLVGAIVGVILMSLYLPMFGLARLAR